MHRAVILAVGALALSAVGFSYMARQPAQSQEGLVTVTIDARCPGEGVQTTVTPWSATLYQGDSIDWVLATDAHADSFTVTSKAGPGNWPFSDPPPYGARGRGVPAGGRDMKPNQAGNRYGYNIELQCSFEGSGPYDVVIDPDMIIKQR
ncbi:MAG: hypothetical protein GWN32_01200 [Gemmatimonadetes bacterium]|nr:hypothetical protein [Gemmatimonadota bacterium]